MDEEKKEVSSETSVEEPSTSETEESAGDKKPDTPTVPLERFREVYGKVKELEEEISTLKAKPETPEQDKELQAKMYLKNLYKEILQEEQAVSSKKEQREISDFNAEVDDVLLVNPGIKREDFLKFIEEKSEDYGLESVSGALKVYKDLRAVAQTASEKAKEELKKKPGLPSHEGGGSKPAYDDKGKSLQDIAQEVARGLK